MTEFRMLKEALGNFKTHSTRAKRYAIQARGPPMKVIKLPHTPGIAVAVLGTRSHRSGLRKERVFNN